MQQKTPNPAVLAASCTVAMSDPGLSLTSGKKPPRLNEDINQATSICSFSTSLYEQPHPLRRGSSKSISAAPDRCPGHVLQPASESGHQRGDKPKGHPAWEHAAGYRDSAWGGRGHAAWGHLLGGLDKPKREELLSDLIE